MGGKKVYKEHFLPFFMSNSQEVLKLFCSSGISVPFSSFSVQFVIMSCALIATRPWLCPAWLCPAWLCPPGCAPSGCAPPGCAPSGRAPSGRAPSGGSRAAKSLLLLSTVRLLCTCFLYADSDLPVWPHSYLFGEMLSSLK